MQALVVHWSGNETSRRYNLFTILSLQVKQCLAMNGYWLATELFQENETAIIPK